MKNFTITIALFLITTIHYSQTLSYGVLFGATGYSNACDGQPTFKTENPLTGSFGAYAEYNFNENFGIKNELIFHTKTLQLLKGMDGDFKFKTIEICPNFKYDFGNEYRKGFYVIGGPKLALISKVELQGEDVSDNFETSNFGAQLGFGTRFLKHFDFQFKFDYEFSPFYKNEVTKNDDFFLGGIFTLGIDVESIINRKK